jgi:hypothetical protein
VGEANMHLPGRQVDPDRVRRDIVRLRRWEQERSGGPAATAKPSAGRSRWGRMGPDNIRAA